MSKRNLGGRQKKKRAPRRDSRVAAPATIHHIRRDRVSVAEAAELLGISDRRLRQLVVEHRDAPAIGQGKHRQYLWPQLREWRDKLLVQQGVQSVRPGTVEEARARKLAAEADLKEMEAGERRGALMPAALFRQEFEAACQRVAAHQLNAPARYAPQLLAAFADRMRAEDIIRAEEFIRKMMQDQMAELEAGDDIPEDAAEAAS